MAAAPAGLARRALYGVAYLLAFRAMLDKLGLSRVRYAYAGGAPLGTEIFQFFRALGLNLKQVYGQTETSGICVLHPDGEVPGRDGGQAHAGHADPHLGRRRGARRRARASSSATTRTPTPLASALDDGWLRTGDAGPRGRRKATWS